MGSERPDKTALIQKLIWDFVARVHSICDELLYDTGAIILLRGMTMVSRGNNFVKLCVPSLERSKL